MESEQARKAWREMRKAGLIMTEDRDVIARTLRFGSTKITEISYPGGGDHFFIGDKND